MENEALKPKKFLSPFTIFVGIVFFGTIVSNFYFLYIKKDYDFIVEAPCDPVQETCFIRDCSTGECPLNELSSFKRLVINASDFKECVRDDCQIACENGTIECTPLLCEEDIEAGESCSTPPESTPVQDLEE